jgi:hypothetical protein
MDHQLATSLESDHDPPHRLRNPGPVPLRVGGRHQYRSACQGGQTALPAPGQDHPKAIETQIQDQLTNSPLDSDLQLLDGCVAKQQSFHATRAKIH